MRKNAVFTALRLIKFKRMRHGRDAVIFAEPKPPKRAAGSLRTIIAAAFSARD